MFRMIVRSFLFLVFLQKFTFLQGQIRIAAFYLLAQRRIYFFPQLSQSHIPNLADVPVGLTSQRGDMLRRELPKIKAIENLLTGSIIICSVNCTNRRFPSINCYSKKYSRNIAFTEKP